MMVSFSFCKVLYYLFIETTAFAKWLKLDCLTLVFCTAALCVLSLSKYFLCELSKDCNKSIPQKNILSYLFTFNKYVSVLVSLTLVSLISDSSSSN